MTLGIVQTIWNAFSDLVSSTLTIDLIFYIGVGFLLLMALFFFIKARSSYEYKLDRTANKLNDWLYRNQTITEQNLVEFNNIIKDRKSPKILRKYWQQYMLYRDKAPSEYMSTYNCIDKPLKTSSFTSSIKNFAMIYKLTALVTFFLSMFCFAGRTDTILTYLTQSLVASIIILFLGVVLTLALRAMQNYNIAALYQSFNVFARYIDKASATIPKYVDFEILFTKQEINDGIPILGEYLEKRARQEQEELEEAQRNAVSHEEYDFAESGIDGSLVLERAMKESETYINIKQRLLTEIQQFESEISTLKKNYENTSKDYQRKLQASKENMERLRQQQEESTNRIEVNYIRKQQQDEVKKQEQLEKDQEDATNKFNVEVNSLTEEIEKRRKELENKKVGVQEAMLSEYQTFSSKLHKSIAEEVEKNKNESIQQVNAEKEKYAQAITYLKSEVDSRDELIKSKDQTIADLATKLQSYLGDRFDEQTNRAQSNVAQEAQEVKEETANESTLQEISTEQAAQEQETEESQGHYDDRGYYWFNNGTYYDSENLYHDLEGNVYDSDGNLLKTNQVVETEGKESTIENSSVLESNEDKQSAEQNSIIANQPENEVPEEQAEPANTEKQDEQAVEAEEKAVEEIKEKQEPVDGKKDLSGNFTYADGTYYDSSNLYHSNNGKVYNTEGIEVAEDKQPEQTQKRKAGRPKKEQTAQSESANPKRRVGRPKKVVETQESNEEEMPKRKVGRPKKEASVENTQSQPTEKRKAGRPRKEQTKQNENNQAPKRKAGRPKKTAETKQQDSAEQTPKRSVGRPRKEQAQENKETQKRSVGRPKKEKTEPATTKRKVGRPRKVDSADQSARLLQQLGQSLLNITANSNDNN